MKIICAILLMLLCRLRVLSAHDAIDQLQYEGQNCGNKR